ncbi:MAG: uracil-DNA glycosylase [Candidatus Polarisedimenticolaceae bacterium]|nr:uracil-DNA glycosylase [Candidatus Polarisedimenticolaceae bacterium]
MDELNRRQYLDAMGIQQWVLRDSPQEVSEMTPPEVITATVKTAPADATSLINVGWHDLAAAVKGCQACELHKTRRQAVFGVGDPQADLLVIGEAPGADEDRQGEPFVGPAGQLLNAMLLAIGLRREQIFIANILKCRPPGNRDPHVNEMASCEPFLQRQIELIQPKLILSVGRISAQSLLKCDTAVGRLRGQIHHYGEQNIPLIVTYHPAYLLRSPEQKGKSWQDLQMALRTLRGEEN